MNHCDICGLPEKACLHHVMYRDEKNDKRVSRLLWFLIGFVFGLLMLFISSCKTSFITTYKIVTPERNYYCNNFKIIGDSIYLAELQRNGKIHKVYAVPSNKAEILENN